MVSAFGIKEGVTEVLLHYFKGVVGIFLWQEFLHFEFCPDGV